MADFDTVSKHLIQTHPADFARFALQRDDIQSVKVLDTEQPNVRRPDSLLRRARRRQGGSGPPRVPNHR